MDEAAIIFAVIFAFIIFEGEPSIHDSWKLYAAKKAGAISQEATYEPWCDPEDIVAPLICKQGQSND